VRVAGTEAWAEDKGSVGWATVTDAPRAASRSGRNRVGSGKAVAQVPRWDEFRLNWVALVDAIHLSPLFSCLARTSGETSKDDSNASMVKSATLTLVPWRLWRNPQVARRARVRERAINDVPAARLRVRFELHQWTEDAQKLGSRSRHCHILMVPR
jgi:hypothetical protein